MIKIHLFLTTKKLHIEYLSDEDYVRNKQVNYSYAFRRLYKMIEESSDKEFMCRFKEVFKLNDIEYHSLVSEVKSLKKREETDWRDKQEHIKDLEESLSKDKLTKKQRYKIKNKIPYLSRRIGKETCFGGLSIQQALTRECNKKGANKEKILKLKGQLKENRITPFFIVGEANQQGNRFFDLSEIGEGKVIYKPCRGIKINIKTKVSKNWRDELSKVAKLVQSKDLPVSIYLSTDYICLTYDEDVQAELIKEKYKEYYDKQREHKLAGKLEKRCIAIDMNPDNIGYSVLDRIGDGKYKVVACGMLDISRLTKKSGKASSHAKSKYLTNKRRYEVSIMVKYLFKLAMHYKCAYFIMEDLTVKNGDHGAREGNRKINNMWNRELITNLIVRRCNETGIQLVTINPCYTSFIGNIQHPYVDPTNASIEIGRRGLYRYENGRFYPNISEEDIRTLEAKFGDVVECSTLVDWVTCYKSLKKAVNNKTEFEDRFRTGIDEVKTSYRDFSINSYRSRIKLFKFN